ncbi:50S ribosomal protein L19 [Candidatus Peregrinibacteria bacterium]|nr:50S ribosomal protein L19 [Candidatus Peregrinibacteria bacterium]
MTHLAVQEIEKGFINKKVPVLRPGYQVRVHQKIKEGNKERIQVFEGLVVSMNSGHGASKTFTVRKEVQGVAVEKTFPIYSPLIEKIEIRKTLKVRRSKLNFLRGTGVSKRLGAKLGLIDKDEALKKKKGLKEEEPVIAEEKAEEKPAEPTPEEAPKTETVAAEAPAEQAKEEVAKEEAPQEDKAPEEAKSQEEEKESKE